MEITKDKDGTIWIVHPEPYNSGIERNRVATIERNDKADIWDIEIAKGLTKLWLTLVISPTNTEEKVIELVQGIMMFASCGISTQ